MLLLIWIVLRYLWASPATVLGLLPLPIVWLQGGRARWVDGTLEIHGGVVSWLLSRHLPCIGQGAAMTLGHVIWGRDARCLEIARGHERVHVRQYELWGPALIPAYLLASLYLYLRGFDPYLDNPFEQSAYRTVASESAE